MATRYTKRVYNSSMHVIAKPVLVKFWNKYPDAKTALERWHQIMKSETFTSFADLRELFGSADQVGDLVVFNIGGNKYRLIAVIHYNRGKVYIRHVLTHAEYDRGIWRKDE